LKKIGRKFYFPPKGLWQHSLETLEGLEEILSNLRAFDTRRANRVDDYLDVAAASGTTRRTLLKTYGAASWTCKTEYRRKEWASGLRFLGHDIARADMISAAFNALG